MPYINQLEKSESKNNFIDETDLISKFDSAVISSVTRSNTSSALDIDLDERKKKDELALK